MSEIIKRNGGAHDGILGIVFVDPSAEKENKREVLMKEGPDVLTSYHHGISARSMNE